MWPPLLMLDPPCAKSALDYRWNRRDRAKAKAKVCGTPNHASSGGQGTLDLSDDALMFPWESCLTGTEVQFGKGKIGQVSLILARPLLLCERRSAPVSFVAVAY